MPRVKFAFDIDGTLRNLYSIVRRKFSLWSPSNYFDWDKKGYNIYDMVEKDYSILVDAKPTKYVKTIQDIINSNGKIIEIWSHQPEDWINPTTKWIKKYFNSFIAYWRKPEEKYKQLLKEKYTYLVDDYPNFPNYDKIILIDQKYNRNIKAKYRVKNVEEFKKLINTLKNK